MLVEEPEHLPLVNLKPAAQKMTNETLAAIAGRVKLPLKYII
jgi:hypothetical protein